MAYTIGGVIAASDINAWLTTVNNIFGVGTGTRGYGQTSLQAGVVSGNTITSLQWKNLRSMLSTIAAHQGTSASNLVPSTFLDAGDTIFAHINDTGNHAYDIGNLVASVDTNRLTAAAGGMVLSSGIHSLTKSTSWATTTSCTFDIVFSTENAARYFFNTGGEIRVRLVPTGTLLSSSAAQDVDWRSIANTKVGTFTLAASATSRSGSAGTIVSGGGGAQGFYGLNATNTTIYDGSNIGGANYTTNDVLISAAVRNVVGTNGGNGDTVRFTVQLKDDHVNANYDIVSAGMQVVVDVYKVGTSNLTTAIATPTASTVTAWS